MYNIDERYIHFGPGATSPIWQIGVRRGAFKLLWGETEKLKSKRKHEKWNGLPKRRQISAKPKIKLFNLEKDPYEKENLARNSSFKTELEILKKFALEMAADLVPVQAHGGVKGAKPQLSGGIIGPGKVHALPLPFI